MRTIEREIMLRVIDSHWVNHLTGMENLRQGIGLHAFGQRDPLVMYKKEGHEAFQNLLDRIQHDIVNTIFHVSVTPNGGQPGARSREPSGNNKKTVMDGVVGSHGREAVAAGNKKIGRNEPCHCGSGKKYKRCHGAV